MHPDRRTPHRERAFTLLELMTCVIVVSILLVMLYPVYTQIVRRMERTKCIGNLRYLHTATSLYVQDHRVWPQIGTKGVEPKDVATAWINTLQPYGVSQINWICPTIQKVLKSPDLGDPENARVDYAAMPFDTNPMTPMRWATTMPWFIENGDVHGNGGLIVYGDGHTQEVGDYLSLLRKQTPHP